MKQHIRYPLINRKPATSLRANKRTLFKMNLKKRVMELPQKLIGFNHCLLGSFVGEFSVPHDLGSIR
ncbi:hypothetical protein Hanom_Chr07g00664961 [Helianthus anomalus]